MKGDPVKDRGAIGRQYFQARIPVECRIAKKSNRSLLVGSEKERPKSRLSHYSMNGVRKLERRVLGFPSGSSIELSDTGPRSRCKNCSEESLRREVPPPPLRLNGGCFSRFVGTNPRECRNPRLDYATSSRTYTCIEISRSRLVLNQRSCLSNSPQQRSFVRSFTFTNTRVAVYYHTRHLYLAAYREFFEYSFFSYFELPSSYEIRNQSADVLKKIRSPILLRTVNFGITLPPMNPRRAS